MKKHLLAAAALVCALPVTASAHPIAERGSFAGLGGGGLLVPTADEGVEAPWSAATTGTNAGVSKNMKLLANLPKGQLRNVTSDLAFWGQFAVMGNYDGFSIINIGEPAQPAFVSETRCPGSQNDVSVYRNLIITSTDSQRNDDSCSSRPFSRAAGDTVPWEGIRIWDWTNPSSPVLVKNIATDCGSHTHTTIPDLENDRLIVYVSSYRPNGTPNCTVPHDKISVVEVPLSTPSAASVIAEPVLFPTGGQPSTSGCHDITAYPAKGLALGACMGEGVVMDITDPVQPQVISTMVDPNFAFWHSATFSDDGEVAMFTDELGGGTQPRCRATDPGNRGADAFYDISDPARPVFKSYFKIQDLAQGRPQTSQEECVSHNGSLIPSKFGRDMLVQAWYQGGISVVAFTAPSKPFEVGFFDRATDTESEVPGGHWSAYWYNGKVYGSEIGRGFDVLNLSGAFDDGGKKLRYSNAQTQEPLTR